jgi:hypothetical protein
MLKQVVAACGFNAALIAPVLAAAPTCDPQRNPIPTTRYEMRGAEVLDKETGLTWQRCSVGQTWNEGEGCTGTVEEFNWQNAKKQARRGWRLPTRDELETLISRACSPSINPEAFPGVDPVKLWYWSSTQDTSGLAWLVQFGGGATFNGYQTAPNAVRLVKDAK